MSRYKYAADGVFDKENNIFIPYEPADELWQEYLAYDGTTDPEFTAAELEEKAWSELRSQRDELLRSTDFMMTYDFYMDKMNESERTEVSTYREQLRDLPSNTLDPTDITWPTKPQIIVDQNI